MHYKYISDFYPAALDLDNIRAGTTVYDPAGHAAIIYKIEKDGRIKMMDAHPDQSITHITFDKKFEVVSNGVLESKETLKDQTVWRYKMERPMSSYLLMLAIGEYNVYHQKSQSGVGLEFFLEKIILTNIV